MSRQQASPFSPRVVLGMLVFGVLAFVSTLYFIGAGEFGGNSRSIEAHARASGLNGYRGMVELLEERGYYVETSRNPARNDDEVLLVLTPPRWANADEINDLLERRRWSGPTIIIMPKWLTSRARSTDEMIARDGWVDLQFPLGSVWEDEIGSPDMIETETLDRGNGTIRWTGFGLRGALPEATAVRMQSDELVPLVLTDGGEMLAGFWDNGGYYPYLSDVAGVLPNDDENTDNLAWPVVFISEPDLMNNYGLADRTRATLAVSLIEATLEEERMPIVFDITLNGFGQTENLMTLAFRPPFLAATLSLLLVTVVIAWRAMRRFGPPLAQLPVFAFGKRQLATNGAALIQRSRRLHLLGAPYADIERERIGKLLGLKPGGEPGQIETEIDRILNARGMGAAAFTTKADALRRARRPSDLLRLATALKQIEKELAK